MGNKGKNDLFRDFSVKLLFPLFWKSGLSANTITIGNFLTFGLLSVVLFARGYEYLGLLVAGISAMIDYVDGTVARSGRGSPKGPYLDTSLDWLWLMMLVWSISFYHDISWVGSWAIIAITFGNWVQYNGKQNIRLVFPFGISHLMVFGIIFGRADIGIIAIAITQTIRTGVIYLWSILRD